MADRRARPVVVAGRKRGLDVILMARGDREPDRVDQKLFTFVARRLRQARGVKRADFLSENLGDRGFGEV